MAGINTYSANAFADNFMKGFSFVDEIKKSRRNEARLEERLAQQEEEREFQRQRQVTRDRQVLEDRETYAEDRQREIERQEIADAQIIEDRATEASLLDDRLASEGKRRAGIAMLNRVPRPSDEELAQYAPFTPEIQAHLAEQARKREIADAMTTAGGLYQQPAPTVGGVEGAAGTTTTPGAAQQPPLTLSQAARMEPGQAGEPPPTFETGQTFFPHPSEGAPESTTTAGTFGPNIGSSSIQEIDRSNVRAFSDELQANSFGGQVAAETGGFLDTIRNASAQVLEKVGGFPERYALGEEAATSEPLADLRAMTSTTDEFVTLERLQSEEFADLSPEERDAIAARNREIIQEQSDRGSAEGVLSSELGAIQRGGTAVRREAEIVEAKTVANWHDFATDPNSKLTQMAMENPRATSNQYLAARATLEASERMTPEELAVIDRRMVPVMDQHVAEVEEELFNTAYGSAERRRLQKTRDNLRESRNKIAKDQASITEQTEPKIVNGLKVGDEERATAVVETFYDPSRPRQDPVPPSQIAPAIAVASRISPATRRLNEKQIQALAVLAEANYMSKETALQVTMTGQWPPGKNPRDIAKLQTAGGAVYATLNDGSTVLMPNYEAEAKRQEAEDKRRFEAGKMVFEEKSKRAAEEREAQREATKGGDNEPIDRTLNDQRVGWAMQGLKMAGIEADSAAGKTLEKWIWDHAGKIRQGFNVDNQESMVRLGSIMAQNMVLSQKQTLSYATDWNYNTNPDDVLMFDELMYSRKMREAYADEHNMELIQMPAIENRTGLDIAQLQAAADEGAYGAKIQQMHRRGMMEEEDYLWQFFVREATPEQIRAAQQQAGE